ncbi:MAG: 50S ribosomal protein L22 [Candidatus Doudnabacteria bacterium]|nr:50S ribosomal protein L22 [Candidatus Doudnabacteria bacterium]
MSTRESVKVTEVKAFARYIHVSPRKLRLVADLVRNARVDQALEQLKFSSKKAAIPLSKAINSAIANAIHNFDLKREDLFIKSLTVDGGPVYKRYAPRAQGRAFIERKRTSHINVVLGSKEVKAKPKSRSIFVKARPSKEEPKEKFTKNEIEEGKVEENTKQPKQAPKSREKIKRNIVDLKRRLFNRKSGQ